MNRSLSIFAALVLLPGFASAQTTLTGDHTITGNLTVANGFGGSLYVEDDSIIAGRLCLGHTCSSTTTFATDETLRLMYSQNVIDVVDTSNSTTYPDRDWRLRFNDNTSSGIEKFSIEDRGAEGASTTTPFTIEGGAPENALYVEENGDIGFGTSQPQARLHMVYGDTPTIRLQQDTSNGFAARTWEIAANEQGFFVKDVTSGNNAPFRIEARAGDGRLVIDDAGRVGIGTGSPDAPLEMSADETYNFFRITATDAAVNQSVDITFTQGPLGTGQLRYNIVDGDNQEMSLDADGNMVLDGTLTTGGPKCSGGCDAVFTEKQIIPAADYAAQMWANGHLPHVGPTAPGEAFNMTEKMGGMLNALEHAHIYIEDLNRDNATQAAQIEEQAKQIAALTALVETLVAQKPRD